MPFMASSGTPTNLKNILPHGSSQAVAFAQRGRMRHEAGRVQLQQAVQRCLLGAVALVVERGTILRLLWLPADACTMRSR